MKSFLKYVLATFVGIILSSIVLFFFFFGMVGIILASQEKAIDIKPNSILYLKLDQQIVDRKPASPFELGIFSMTSRIGLNDLLADIKKAKMDPNIEGIHLDLTFLQAGIATIKEIRTALLDFRESGKFVTVYTETMSQGAYYLASSADKIYLSPVGFMEWVGLRTQSPFFKNALDKLDIEATVIRHGKFKSYGERFSESEYSAENSEQLQRLIHTFWMDILGDIEKSRHIPVDQLNEMADKLMVAGPEAAYELGLVDSLLYMNEVIGILKTKSGIETDKDLRLVTLSDYSNVPVKKDFKGLAKDKIAVIYALGDIMSGEGDDLTIGSDKFSKTIRQARKDSTIKAIVVRVNSPGGSAIASDAIWHELNLARKDKPVIVSMGDVAGGYYISCMADSILAQPTTITGSIGVIGLHINAKGLLNKYGITFDTEKTNPFADFLSGVRAPSAAELNYWQNMVDNFYTTFVNRIDEGRRLSYDEIDALGQGRVWSGIDAFEHGLVDKLGGLQDAVETARRMAGLDERYRIIELPKQEDPLEKLLKDLTESRSTRMLEKTLGIPGDYISTLKFLVENQGILARMPVDLHIQ